MSLFLFYFNTIILNLILKKDNKIKSLYSSILLNPIEIYQLIYNYKILKI